MGGRGATYTGIEPRADSIRITFIWQGERRRETVKIKPTAANLRHCARLRETILHEIGIGSFDYAAHFPESKHVKKHGLAELKAAATITPITFAELAARWIGSQSHLSKGTLTGYRGSLSRWWLPEFGDLSVESIRFSKIAEAVGAIEWTSAKSRNNALIPLRQVFDMAWADGILPNNPTARIRNQKAQQEPPDPFTHSDADNIITHLRERYNPQVANYFQFAFYAGVRPEEAIALRWGDYDQKLGVMRIQRAYTYGEEKTTKTNKVRDINLTAQAVQALTAQKQHTFMAGNHVFLNPETGRPWADQAKQRVRYWIPALKKLGIRYRPPYNCRHTYATMMLMAGCNPAYAASQMGHSLQVFFNVYARWIQGQAHQAEQDKLRGFLGDCPVDAPKETPTKLTH